MLQHRLRLGASAVALLASSCASEIDDGATTASDLAESTCSPTAARGAVNRYQKALHDSIAYAEGTEGFGRDGYDIAFGYHVLRSCAHHPRTVYCQGGLCSSASGRYQFLDRTWDRVAAAIGATDFEPRSQELAAQYLITRVRRVSVPSTRALRASELSAAMRKLSWEWASLPPGRYGQPTKTERQMWTDYTANIAALTTDGATRAEAARVAD